VCLGNLVAEKIDIRPDGFEFKEFDPASNAYLVRESVSLVVVNQPSLVTLKQYLYKPSYLDEHPHVAYPIHQA